MVVHYLDLVGVSFAPDKADAPLLVDSDAVLPASITRKGFQSIPWRNPQIVDGCGIVQNHQFPLSPALNILRELADAAPLGDGLGISVAVGLDHIPIIVSCTISANHKQRRGSGKENELILCVGEGPGRLDMQESESPAIKLRDTNATPVDFTIFD